jgi:hypothetical protein
MDFNPMDSDLESSVQLPEIVVPVPPAEAVVASKTVKARRAKERCTKERDEGGSAGGGVIEAITGVDCGGC